jgi:flagellar basal body rod protein FlgG
MIYGLWQSAGGMQAQEYRQAIIAHNLANAETPGYKADRIAFVERLNASQAWGPAKTRHPVLDGMTGGVFETDVYTDFLPHNAPLLPSDDPLDVAVVGDGFLTVQTPQGRRYTRDGRLTLDRGGALIHVATGGAVLDAQGQPIYLDPASKDRIMIDSEGVVKQGNNIAGRLGLADFADRQQLEKVGQNLFSAEGLRSIEGRGQIRQYATEGSGVDPVSTLVEMIAATRAYEANARLLTLQDETLGRVVNDVGRVA